MSSVVLPDAYDDPVRRDVRRTIPLQGCSLRLSDGENLLQTVRKFRTTNVKTVPKNIEILRKIIEIPWAAHLRFGQRPKAADKHMQSDVTIAGPFNILLVDDDPATRILLTTILRQPGYAFTEADHGAQALELLEKSCFDLIITDLRMPDLDGIAFAVRAHARWPHIPIVLMSGYFSETAWKLDSEIFGGFIQKPINGEILIPIVQRLLVKSTAKSHEPINSIPKPQ
jgi:CheY-like chemotaxis protein